MMKMMMMMMMMTASNGTQNSVFCHALRKISNGVLCSLLSLLAACIQRLVNGVMQSKLYYASIWLKIGIAGQRLIAVLHIEFQHNPCSGLWDVWNSTLWHDVK
jgi:hypothetical protein